MYFVGVSLIPSAGGCRGIQVKVNKCSPEAEGGVLERRMSDLLKSNPP